MKNFSRNELLNQAKKLRSDDFYSDVWDKLDKYITYLKNSSDIPQMEEIPSEYLSQGPVYKQPVGILGIYEFALLMVPSQTGIEWHFHDQDKEYYIFLDKKEIRLCHRGMEHNFFNDTDTDLLVLSIKQQL